jgi:hypothetical protein
MQPTWTPANMSFEVDDATLPWTWDKNRFDFIHIRYLMGSIRDWTALFKEAFAHTKPGGWIQSAEVDCDFRSDDGTIDGVLALQKWNQFFVEAGKATGAVFSVVADDLQRKGLAAAGYTDIEAKTFKVRFKFWRITLSAIEFADLAVTMLIVADTHGRLGPGSETRGDWSRHQRRPG